MEKQVSSKAVLSTSVEIKSSVINRSNCWALSASESDFYDLLHSGHPLRKICFRIKHVRDGLLATWSIRQPFLMLCELEYKLHGGRFSTNTSRPKCSEDEIAAHGGFKSYRNVIGHVVL